MTFDSQASDFDNVTLVREQRSRVRDLKGYRRTHRVPTEVNDHANNFVARIAVEDLSEDLDARFAAFRKLLKFKRIDLEVQEPEGGTGIIVTPWFDYQISASLAPDDASEVLWRRQIASFRRPQELFSPAFSLVFGHLFDTVELIPPSAIDLAELIDRIEERNIATISLEYDRNATWCQISLQGISGEMRLTPDRVSLVVAEPQPPSRLLEAFLRARSQFSGIECF
jgi:hypothetical protein